MELQKRVVEEKVFEILKKIMTDEDLTNFFLVGGTALALSIGHRISIDLDLFTRDDINVNFLQKKLSSDYNFNTSYKEKNTIKGYIEGVKVDFIKYDYPFIKNILNIDNIRILSLEDIASMKLSTILDNGTRVKDFVDIAYLSTKFSLNQMIEFYSMKFYHINPILIVKSLLYHEDIVHSESIHLINNKFKWGNSVKRLVEMIDNPNKIFTRKPDEQLIDMGR